MVTEPLFPGVDPYVGAFIRGYCGWHVAPSVVETVTLDASAPLLRSLHVTAVGSVTVDGALYTADQFDWSEVGSLTGWFGVKRRSVVVTFTHGYPVCPPDLEQVASRLAELQASKIPAGGSVRVGQIQVSGGSVDASGLDPFCRGVLDRYKLPPRP